MSGERQNSDAFAVRLVDATVERSATVSGIFHIGSCQLRFGAANPRLSAMRDRRGVSSAAPSLLLSSRRGKYLISRGSLVGHVDPKLTAAVPSLQVRVLDTESFEPLASSKGPIQPRPLVITHAYRGIVTAIGDESFVAVLRSESNDDEEYEVEIPVEDLTNDQRSFLDSGIEFSLELSTETGRGARRQVDRQFEFDDQLDEIPAFDPAAVELAREEARQELGNLVSVEPYDKTFDDPEDRNSGTVDDGS